MAEQHTISVNKMSSLFNLKSLILNNQSQSIPMLFVRNNEWLKSPIKKTPNESSKPVEQIIGFASNPLLDKEDNILLKED
jgi:hypothetical protein